MLRFQCYRELNELHMVGLAGVRINLLQTSSQFYQWKDEFELLLWQTNHLLLDEESMLRVFMMRHRLQLQLIQTELLGYCIKPVRLMAERKRNNLYKCFSRVMECREMLLTELHLESLDTVACVRQLDRQLLDATQLMRIHIQAYSILED